MKKNDVTRLFYIIPFIFILFACVFLILSDNDQLKEQLIKGETVTLSYDASSKDFVRAIINHISHSSDNFNLTWKGSSLPIKFVLHEVMCADPIKKAARSRLYNESLRDGDVRENEEIEIFRIYFYKNKIIAQNKHTSKDELYNKIIKFQKTNLEFCIVASFEEEIPLSLIWDVLVSIYKYSDSRVVIAPSIKEIYYLKNSETIY